jgi:hypothetical protein
MSNPENTKFPKGLIVERIGEEQRELCPFIPDRCHYMAHSPNSPLYTFGKSPNAARKNYRQSILNGRAHWLSNVRYVT